MDEDVLGQPYRRRVIELGSDDEGAVVATLVSRRAEAPARRAVLHVHGYVDYFFQTHLADFFVERGWDFYALDLRKYGRSLLPHQTPNFCRTLADYHPELDEAVRIIREEDGHDALLISAHSTGGLIAALWAHARRELGLVDGMFLNSPFFDINAGWLLRRPLASAIGRSGRGRPYRVVPLGLNRVYGESLHAEHRGEWTYNLAWKPLDGFPVRAGWVNAVVLAQRELRAGLDIPVPVLVACSTASGRYARWSDAAHEADAVLDVGHIARWSHRLGRHVTLVRIEGGRHDLVLSREPARKRTFSELDRWLAGYLPDGPAARPAPPAGTAATPAPAGPADPG